MKKHQSLGLRIWHWLDVMAIAGLILTALLRKGWLSWRDNVQIMLSKSSEMGATLTPETAKELAIALRNQMWDWHYLLGYLLSSLIVFRFFVFLSQRKNKVAPPASLYKKAVQYGYYVFYAVVTYMAFSGLLMHFKKELGVGKDFADLLKEVHEFLIWFFYLFIVGHVIGVFAAENRDEAGIVSDMINGGKTK
jgi:Ni/Fe-hydrogenase 1 B-type cytochrome subunit